MESMLGKRRWWAIAAIAAMASMLEPTAVAREREAPHEPRRASRGLVEATAGQASALDALPWDQRIGLERVMAESDSRHAPRAEGGAAAIESRGVSARIASTAHLTIAGHQATLRATSLGRGDARTELREVDAVIVGAEVRAERASGVVEWWRELASGLEHGVTIVEKPEGDGELEVELEVRGVETRSAGDDAIELLDGGEVIARYAHLTVLDAGGERVPARMRASAAGIVIDVDDAHADYPMVIDPTLTGTQEAMLLASDGAVADSLGLSVALSANGSRALVGVPFDDTAAGADAGSARLFVRTGTTWTEEATLLASDGSAGDRFGWSVALAPNGDRALVGAVWDDTPGGGDAGSVRVFVRSGTTWTQEATLLAPDGAANDNFGYSVALASSGLVLVGAYRDDTAGGIDAGSARVFVRSGTTWTQEATLLASDGAANDNFGSSVALTTQLALVGAYRDDTAGGVDAGSARVFLRSGTGAWALEATLLAPDGAANDWFGYSVALSLTGDRALVGVLRDSTAGADVGSARVFFRTVSTAKVPSPPTWAQEATLLAPDGAAGDGFGCSVALTAGGDRALVGAMWDDTLGGTDAGSARVFVRADTSWSHEVTLLAPDAAANDGLGFSLGLTSSGDRALVGAPSDGTVGGISAGTARVFGPADPNGTSCSLGATCLSGFCVDGVCCDTACGAGSTADCQACSAALTGGPAGTCAAASPSVTCRAAAGPCDVVDVCDGASLACPSDARVPAGTVCRVSAGACDADEACDGTSVACPADIRVPSGVVCRAPLGPCDAAEACDGVSVSCPGDAFLSAATVCRASRAFCDIEDRCSGTSPACPDVFRAAGEVCGPSGGDVCDAPDVCAGTSADCVATFLSGVVCRASAGGCDVAESCAGDSPTCPPDAVQGVGTVCRGSTDPSCDPTEACDGMAAECPMDVTSCAPRPDAGPMADAGVLADAGPHDAAVSDGSTADASTGNDAGGTPPAAVGGCGCHVEGARPGGAISIVCLFALVGFRRRAHRHARRG